MISCLIVDAENYKAFVKQVAIKNPHNLAVRIFFVYSVKDFVSFVLFKSNTKDKKKSQRKWMFLGVCSSDEGG
jgi:hypothetical protein